MKRLIITAVTIGLSLAAVTGAVAQDKTVSGITTNADGSNVTSTAGVNPTANGEGGTIIYGDLNLSPGTNIIGPPSAVSTAPPEAVPEAASEPAPVTTTESTTAETAVTDSAMTDSAAADTAVTDSAADTAVSTPTDLDADNYADDLAWEFGLDPTNIDTDGDGVADGDELNIYGTDATVYDTDGDEVGDGDELYDIRTDPLVWDDFSAESTEAATEQAGAESSELSAESADAATEQTGAGSSEL